MSFYHLNATFTMHELRQSLLCLCSVDRPEDEVLNDFLLAGVLQCCAGALASVHGRVKRAQRL